MNWNIAQAKQRFSEVVRDAVHEPQIIYNRNTPVAAVIAAEELAAYQVWKAEGSRKTIGEEFAELRRLLIEADHEDGLEPSPWIERPNPFLQVLEEDYPEMSR